MRVRLLSSQNEKIEYTLESQQGIGGDTPAISLRETLPPSHGKVYSWTYAHEARL